MGGAGDDYEGLRAPFSRWLARRWPDAEGLDGVEVGAFESPRSGFSATTLFAPVHLRRGGSVREARVVLRLEPPEPAIYPQQAPGLDVEVELQFRVMQAIAAAGAAPIAPLIGYEPDPAVLGAPFFAMRHVDGQVAIENPPYTQQGFFVETSPDLRRRMIEGGLAALASVHRLDWRAAGLDWLVPPGTRPGLGAQLDLWERYGRRELGDRVHPVFDAGCAWLRANRPGEPACGFSWGDSRLGNIIFSGGEVACITDFENAAIAPPEIDIGWWLMFDRTQHECAAMPRLAGEPTRDEQRALYARLAGRDLPDTHYYEVFGAMRYTAIVARVMNRGVDRGLVPPDHQIWLRNPAANCLADLLGMERP